MYRGSALGAAYRGRYFFADFIRSRVWSLALSVNAATGEATASNRIEHTTDLGGPLSGVSSFGVDADGELYVLNHSNGTVVKIIASSSAPSAPTGLRIIR